MMKRLMIIGGSGSGKSTTARMLGAITGLPVVHIDPMYYTAGWVSREAEETRQMIFDAIAEERWVFEGNQTSTFPERLARVDVLIFLDLPAYLRLWRAVTRMIKYQGKSRPDMAEGCPERFDWWFLKWVVSYGKVRRLAALDAMHSAPDHVKCYHLKSRREVRQFLADMEAKYEQT